MIPTVKASPDKRDKRQTVLKEVIPGGEYGGQSTYWIREKREIVRMQCSKKESRPGRGGRGSSQIMIGHHLRNKKERKKRGSCQRKGSEKTSIRGKGK